jgi:DNA-binding beta-propeller fold protein YncE
VVPSHIYPGPAGLTSIGQPQSNGVMWILAGSTSVKALDQLDLSSSKVLGAVPESPSADCVAQSPSGVLAVGLATPTSGAVELHNGATGALVATIPVGDPVRQVAFGADGTTLYVLNGTASSMSIAVVDTQAKTIQGSIGVSLATVAIAPTPEQTAIWTLQSSGSAAEVATAGTTVLAQFPVGHSGAALALSPSGNTLYALKGHSTAPNVAVVDLATEQVSKVLPAPADAVAIAVAPSGSALYVGVGTPTLGNVQAFSLAG